MAFSHLRIEVNPEDFIAELTPSQHRELESLIPADRIQRDPEVRATYGGDESPVQACLPAAVVVVENAHEVSALLNFAHRERIPVTPRGGGSGKVGGAVPLYGGIVLALERMNRLKCLDPENRQAQVEPGLITGTLRETVAERKLYYPVDPNSLDMCTLGGNVASNASGPTSMKYGSTRNHVLELEVVLANGETLRLGRKTAKCSTGYDLASLMVGSEGTLGVVTGITLRLSALPSSTRTLFATFESSGAAVSTLSELKRGGVSPCAAEFFDRHSMKILGKTLHLPDGAMAGLLIELDGEDEALDRSLERMGDLLGDRAKDVLLAKDEAERRRLWESRHTLSSRVKERFAGWVSEDIAVPPARLSEMVAAIERLRAESGLEIICYGHAGDGNLHVNFLYQSLEQMPAVEVATEQLIRAALALEGTLSGEHGIGASKRRFMHLEQSAALLETQRRIKKLLDPHGILNPGKVLP